MSFLKRFRLPSISYKYVYGPLNIQRDSMRRIYASAAVIFEKIFGMYGTLKSGDRGITWICDEKPSVVASLESDGKYMTLEIHDDDSSAGIMTAFYFFFLFTAIITIMSLYFFFYMYYFFFQHPVLSDMNNLWMRIDMHVASLKWQIIFSWSLLPVLAALMLLLIKRVRIYRLIKKGGAEIQGMIEKLIQPSSGRFSLPSDMECGSFFDIRMNGIIDLPRDQAEDPVKKEYSPLSPAIDDFFRTGQFIGTLPPAGDFSMQLAEGYTRRAAHTGDYVTSVTLYNHGNAIGVEAREDHSSEWPGTGGRLAAGIFFLWFISYFITQDYIFDFIGIGHYYKRVFLHIGILFTGFLLILAASMAAGFVIEIFMRNSRYKMLKKKFRKLMDDAASIINS